MTDIDTSLIEVNSLMSEEELKTCEVVIEKGKQTFIEVGNALREIRDRKGYRHQYGTFEDYCKQRWGFSVRTGKNLIDAAKTSENLQAIAENVGYTKAERISTLQPDQQITFAETHDIAAMTSREVEKAVKEYKLQLADAEQRVNNLAAQLKETTDTNQALREENLELANKPPEVEEVVPKDYDKLKREVTVLALELQTIQRQSQETQERTGRTTLQLEEDLLLLTSHIQDFLRKVAPLAFLKTTVGELGDFHMKQMNTHLDMLEEWTYAMKDSQYKYKTIEGEVINVQ